MWPWLNLHYSSLYYWNNSATNGIVTIVTMVREYVPLHFMDCVESMMLVALLSDALT